MTHELLRDHGRASHEFRFADLRRPRHLGHVAGNAAVHLARHVFGDLGAAQLPPLLGGRDLRAVLERQDIGEVGIRVGERLVVVGVIGRRVVSARTGAQGLDAEQIHHASVILLGGEILGGGEGALTQGRPGRIEIEPDQPQRIERDAAVRGQPVKVRAGHAPRRAHFTDLLAARHRVAHRDQGAAEMQVPGDEPRAMIDQHGSAAQIEVGDEGHDATVCRPHARAAPAGEVDAHVTAAQHAVEHACHAEPISQRARPGPHERLVPQPRSVVRLVPHASHQLLFFLDPFLERVRRLRQVRCHA